MVVPAWIVTSIQQKSEQLMLKEWSISVRPQDERDVEEARMTTTITATIRHATIAIHRDILAEPETNVSIEQALYHEVLHVFLADLQEWIMEDLISLLYNPVAMEGASRTFRRILETRLDLLACVLNAQEQKYAEILRTMATTLPRHDQPAR